MIFLTISFANQTSVANKNKTTFLDGAELPNWIIGNFWVYDMNFDFTYSGIFNINGAIKDMKMEVVEINENQDEYILNITGKINAELKIFGIIPGGTYDANLIGFAYIEKSTLGIKNFEFYSTGEYFFVQTDVDIYMSFDPVFDFFDFPIEIDEEPWNADTYGTLNGHIKVGNIYETDFDAEGPFEDETISFIKKEDITVPGGSYESYLISGSMGPSHGGESKLWYSPDAGYLVKIIEEINDWEGVDAVLDMPLKATNYNPGNYPPKEVDIHIYQLEDLDDIDYWPLTEPEWYYTVKVASGNIYQEQSNYNTDDGTYEGNWISQHIWTADEHHQMFAYSRYITLEIQVMDYDPWPDADDVADISSDVIRRTFVGIYDLLENELISIGYATDYVVMQGEWYKTSGELPPDESTNEDEDDALVLFAITDNYEAPEQPSSPEGPTNGKTGIEYSYTTSANDPDGDKIYYKFDWGDGTYSYWLGPYDPNVEIEASHIWNKRGSYQIKVIAKDVYGAESPWSDPISISIPRVGFSFNQVFIRLLEQFPNSFLILRYLLEFL